MSYFSFLFTMPFLKIKHSCYTDKNNYNGQKVYIMYSLQGCFFASICAMALLALSNNWGRDNATVYPSTIQAQKVRTSSICCS